MLDATHVGTQLGGRVQIDELFGEDFVELLDLSEHVAFLVPNKHLLREFWNDEKRAPSALLLRLNYVTKDVVSHVQYVFTAATD